MQITINDLLYELVNDYGFTADDIADDLGVKPETVGKWLSGTKTPGKDSSVTLLELYKKQDRVEDDITLSDDVQQTAVHHASADDTPTPKPDENAASASDLFDEDTTASDLFDDLRAIPRSDENTTFADNIQDASKTNNESEDTANMSDNKETVNQEQEGQSIRSKASVFFNKPTVRNVGKVIVGALALGAAGFAGAYGEKRRGANTPV